MIELIIDGLQVCYHPRWEDGDTFGGRGEARISADHLPDKLREDLMAFVRQVEQGVREADDD